MRKYKTGFALLLLLVPFMVQAQSINHVRGTRYCEILLSDGNFVFNTYNTFGLNDCPQSLWSNVTEAKIKRETKARFVILNGPRMFMMDGMTHTSLVSDKPRTFNGIQMRLAGILHLKFTDFLNRKPYHQHEVDRKTTWVYSANKPIYELIDKSGNVYVLQSYSLQVEPQTMKSLAALGQRLKLPQGWRFRTGILNHRAEVVAVNNKAVVIQDELKNTYQLASTDLLG